MSEKFKLFEEALIMLCIHHNVCLTVSDVYASLDVSSILEHEIEHYEDFPYDIIPLMTDYT